jgi:alpha-ketoglutarate-dependent taurine dioxygenase
MYMSVNDTMLINYDYEVIKKPRAGIAIRDSKNIGLDKLPKKYLEWLTVQFGFVVLKKIDFEQHQELVEFAEPYGDIYQWRFGPVHVVKVDDKPDGFVHSKEKLPLHWDLSMLPLDHEKVKHNEYFCNRLIMLYCRHSSNNGGGETTIVDSRNALQLAGKNKVRNWENTDITYFTKATYFGGAPRTYPLVWKHPGCSDPILRYQEGSNLDIQQFELSSASMDSTAFDALVQDVNEIAYDDRCMVSHDWEEGDLLLIDNYYTLHGRHPMSSSERELWRVQII